MRPTLGITLLRLAELDSMERESKRDPTTLRRVGNDADALAVANALPYGLAAYVYSRDLERAWSFAERLECGAVGVNVNDTTELQAPFGGWKLSGLGRELGPEGLMAFRECKRRSEGRSCARPASSKDLHDGSSLSLGFAGLQSRVLARTHRTGLAGNALSGSVQPEEPTPVPVRACDRLGDLRKAAKGPTVPGVPIVEDH